MAFIQTVLKHPKTIKHQDKEEPGALGKHVLKDSLDLFNSPYKLDQETWLCQAHLDDFLVKNLTILDLVIEAILLNLWYF